MALQTLVVILIAIAIAIVWFRRDSRRSARRDFHKAFNVRPEAKLEQADMGRGHGLDTSQIMFADGLSAKPDALFKDGNRLIVGEYKKARLRGRIRRRDYYQATLYMGMLKTKYPHAEVEARLLYANERRTVAFDPKLYRWLQSQRPECLALLNKAGL